MESVPTQGTVCVDGSDAAACSAPSEASHLDGTLALRDGTVARVRPIQADDVDRLIAFHMRLSPEAIAYRYFSPMPRLSPARATWLTHVDYVNRMALVATIGQGTEEQIIAVVRYERIGADAAEVAFLVEDRCQGHGIATQLLYRLAEYGRRHGFTHFLAEMMATNNRMRAVLRGCGFPFSATYQQGVIDALLDITRSPNAAFAPRGEPSGANRAAP
jgi:RimJ/RimL family protein N-acetyltransferase